MPLVFDGRTLAADNEGYFLDPGDWSEALAEEIARREEVPLSEDRWTVARFVREYFEFRQSVPEARYAQATQTHAGHVERPCMRCGRENKDPIKFVHK